MLERAARDLPLDTALHVVDETTGDYHVGGEAALAIVDQLPGGWLLRPWRAAHPWRAIVGTLYEAVAANRHAIGHALGLHGPSCEVRAA